METDRLKNLLKSMSQLSLNSISLLREQLRSIKEDSHCDKEELAAEFKRLDDAWIRIKTQTETNERELINRLTVDHELELNDMRTSMLAKDDEIASLKCDNVELKHKMSLMEANQSQTLSDAQKELDTLKTRVSYLEKQVAESEKCQEKAVNLVKEKMIREHKTEVESLRCRFKLMTTTERSPSDGSLEKIDRPEYLDCDRNRSLLASSPKSPNSGQSLYKRILDEKERQMDLLNGQVQVLSKDNSKLKDIIQSLTDNDQSECAIANLKNQVEALQKDKSKLKQKLNVERSRRMELSSIDKGLVFCIR